MGNNNLPLAFKIDEAWSNFLNYFKKLKINLGSIGSGNKVSFNTDTNYGKLRLNESFVKSAFIYVLHSLTIEDNEKEKLEVIKKISSQIHQISYFDNSMIENNLDEYYKEILDFIYEDLTHYLHNQINTIDSDKLHKIKLRYMDGNIRILFKD